MNDSLVNYKEFVANMYKISFNSVEKFLQPRSSQICAVKMQVKKEEYKVNVLIIYNI